MGGARLATAAGPWLYPGSLGGSAAPVKRPRRVETLLFLFDRGSKTGWAPAVSSEDEGVAESAGG
eukprot:14915359-Heterocapsa_arctica.AAC.1